jgi:hypothetical protein
MKSHFFPVLGAFLIVAACSGLGKEYVLKVKPHKLSLNTIYDKDLVCDMIFDAEEQDVDSLKSRSRALFLQGVDLYKNKHKPGSAVAKFRASILVFPDAKTYYELGNALLDSHLGKDSREEALKAYEVAEDLQFQPAAQINYKRACIAYTAGEAGSAMWLLRRTFSEGLFDTSAVARDPWLRGLSQSDGYRSMVTDVLAARAKGNTNTLFDLYKRAFTRDASTFSLYPEQVDMKAFTESISYDFAPFIPEMENTSFSREVSNDYFYVGKVKETAEYVALLYTSVSFDGDEMQPALTSLVVYDTQGKIISRKLVACQCSAEKIKRCDITDGTVVVEDYERQWEKPVTEVPFDENRITAHNLLAKATFRIDETGNIVAQDVPANYNDSTVFAQKK